MSERSIQSIVVSLGKLSTRWLNPQYSFRQKAVRRLVRRSGFSENMAEAMMDAIFSELTEAKLWKLLKAELKNPRWLDYFERDNRTAARLRARGPKSILHIFAGNAPQAPILSFVLGMLLKSRNVGKLSRSDEGFLDIYLNSLKTADLALWRKNALIDPKDQKAFLSHAKSADLVVAYGGDENLTKIREKVPVTTPFFVYGHRVSVALYQKEALNEKNAGHLAKLAAHDVWMADQRGCLSPTTIYVERGGRISPEQLAAHVAEELQKTQGREKAPPRRDISAAVTAQKLQNLHWVQKIRGKASGFFESRPRGLWVVVCTEDLKPVLASSSQVIFIKGYKKIGQVFSALRPIQKYLQCVALECAPAERKKLAEKLASLGVNRICRAGQMQHPPITWHHDGKPNLASWIRWTDLEY